MELSHGERQANVDDLSEAFAAYAAISGEPKRQATAYTPSGSSSTVSIKGPMERPLRDCMSYFSAARRMRHTSLRSICTSCQSLV